MDERIKMTDKEIKNYFIREQKVIDYGWDFFKDICACSMSTKSCVMINNHVLPISCFNEMDEMLASVEQGINYKVVGGFVKACEKQAYIRIGIDTGNSILNKRLKRTVRHEIIHYVLWLLDLPHDDDSLEFWCLCYAFDGGAYEELSFEDEEYYELFIEIYDKYVKNLQWNAWHLIVGQMITCISTTSMDKYTEVVLDIIKKIKDLYQIQ